LEGLQLQAVVPRGTLAGISSSALALLLATDGGELAVEHYFDAVRLL
jgi:hypothetical protein